MSKLIELGRVSRETKTVLQLCAKGSNVFPDQGARSGNDSTSCGSKQPLCTEATSDSTGISCTVPT